MKTIKAYEVDGELYRNKVDAEKAEERLKKENERKRLLERRDELIKEVRHIQDKLGIVTIPHERDSVVDANTRALQDIKNECDKLVFGTQPKFKVGDEVFYNKNIIMTGRVAAISGDMCRVVRTDGNNLFPQGFVCQQYFSKIEPKFKVGDRVRHRTQKRQNGKPFLGTIMGESQYPQHTIVHWDNGACGRGCAEDSLEKIEDTPPPRFKVGDHVKIWRTTESLLASGTIVEVFCSSTPKCHHYKIRTDGTKKAFHVAHEQQLEKIEDKHKKNTKAKRR